MTIEFEKTTITFEVIHRKGYSPTSIEDAVYYSEHGELLGLETDQVTEDLTLEQVKEALLRYGKEQVSFSILLENRPFPAIEELAKIFYEMKDEAAEQGLSEKELLWWPHKVIE